MNNVKYTHTYTASTNGQGYSALAELTEKMNSIVMQRELKENR
jgi:hypothetical protein